MEKHIETAESISFKKNFFRDLKQDFEKGLIKWKIDLADSEYDSTKFLAKWRGADVLINFERNCTTCCLQGRSCDIHGSCEIIRAGETLHMSSCDDDFVRENIKDIVEEMPSRFEMQQSSDILKILGVESLSSEGHCRHSEMWEKLDQLTSQGLRWEKDEVPIYDLGRHHYRAEYKGVSISVGTGNLLEPSAIVHLSERDNEWTIFTIGKSFDFWGSPWLGTYFCQRCNSHLNDFLDRLNKIYVEAPRKVREKAWERKELAKKNLEAISFAEKAKKMGMALFGK